MLSEKVITTQAGRDVGAALLNTKVMMPGTQGSLVNRQRLLDKLGQELRPLSVIHAPAGFGKTTLLAAWLKTLDLPVAWLSLDKDDNDPVRFMRYLIASIATVIPGFGGTLDQMLSSPQPPHVESLLPTLLQQLESSAQSLMIVFDDYHLIENTSVQQLLNTLVAHRPAQLYFALTSRTEPRLFLPRLRVRRQLSEVTEADLRFTREETAEFLNRIAGLSLTEDDIVVLETRTEGWIAGLQLAALSMENEQDRQAFIRDFAGDDRYIMDYLTEEVLQRQSVEIKFFLLQTSILPRLNAALCDAVIGSDQSAALLAYLEQNNMFLIPLDSKRCWYRYHHLFADLLRKQLALSNVDPQGLHRRASQWFSEAGYPHEAMPHAFACDDFEQAARVLDQHGKRLFEEGQSPTLMRWYQRLPDELLKAQPERTLSYVWSHFLGCGDVLHVLVDELQTSLDAGAFNLTVEEHKFIEMDLALMAGFHALKQRQISLAKSHGKRIKEATYNAGENCAIAPSLLLAIADFAMGDLIEAERSFTQLVEDVFAQAYLVALNAAICGLGQTLVKQGRLQEAHTHLTECLERLKEKGWDQRLVDTAWLYIALADIAYQRNQLDDSARYLEGAKVAAKQDPWNTLPVTIAARQANIHQAKGESEAAKQCLAKTSGLNVQKALAPFFPEASDDLLALQLRQGDDSDGERWRMQQGLDVDSEIVPERESAFILFVRLLLAQQKVDSAMQLIPPLLLAAEQAHRQYSVVELLMLQALAQQKLKQMNEAESSLQCALDHAAPAGFVRVFLDEGLPLLTLLQRLPKSSYACELLAYAKDKKQSRDGVDSLSKKELKIIELLMAGLSNKEVAETVFVSPNTVKTHIKNIYAKLGVNTRAQMMIKANTLGLFGN